MVPGQDLQGRTAAQPTPAAAARAIEGIYQAPSLHWVGDGFRVAGYFSAIPDAVRKLDPFLLLDYHPTYEYPPAVRPRGVGVHPHRGFETVTLAFQGSVAHHDSTGAGGVIGPGDVQWMTAASGILHKEHHEAGWAKHGGPFQMAQLWVNLPRAHKMDAPHYQAIAADRMGQVALPNDAGQVRIIAGEFQGAKGPAKTYTPMSVLDVRLNAGGTVELPFPARQNVGLLVMQGELTVNGAAKATMHDFVVFENQGDRIVVEAGPEAQLLVLGGEPIGEPVVQYGPFVMNSRREIEQAIHDFNSGKFGDLED
ncbi:MAG: pirin family protein [Deltaproteobacteria bacterium]|nr:pirin family protein [Deltaproteobacteria bacterium]